MNISICITTLNEEGSIGTLLDSLLAQTKKAEEIVIVDGGSKDKTLEIINHYQKRFGGIKLLKERCSRARGRNLSVEMAKNEIIAMTDAGCVARPDWLENLTAPFETGVVDAVAGFYKMTGETPMQKAMSIFLGVKPVDFDVNFLPSTRSIAFRKRIWDEVGGFPETLEDTAEDTIFNLKLVKIKAKMARVKTAVVEWGMPENLTDFFWKVFNYARGDATSKVWIFPGKGLASHNIKALLVIARYLIGLIWLVLAFSPFGLPYLPADATRQALQAGLIIGFLAYLIFAFRKAGAWGMVLQITSDFAVMSGFLSGILGL